MNTQKSFVLALCALLGLEGLAFSQDALNQPVIANASPATKAASKALRPEEMGKPLVYTLVPTQTYSDYLKIEMAIVNNPKTVGRYFDGKMWRKRFVPFYLTLENQGQYPIEVSTGNILLLEENPPALKKTSKVSQLSATKPAAKKSSSKKKEQELPPFVPPTPPGIAFNKSKHVQYGWKSNLGMIALTGLTFGLAAPVTVPSMVVGNMYRGTNKRLANNLQDQSLSRVTVEPGDKMSTWLFYRRDRKKQTLLPRKIVFADVYTPAKEELSSFVIDLQPANAMGQSAVRRKMEEAEVQDLHLYQGKIVAEMKEDAGADKLKDLENLTTGEKNTK